MAADAKVVVGQTHGSDDPESVLIGYLLRVDGLGGGKEVVMWLTKDGVRVATEGCRGGLSVPGAPSIGDLRAEYMDKGGPFFAGPASNPAGSNRPSGSRGRSQRPTVPHEFTQCGAPTCNY